LALRSFASGTLFGRTTGTARPTVLALHGWGRTHRDFDAVLAPGDGTELDAVAVDLPGFGATPPPPEPWGSPEYAECLLPLLEDLAVPVVVLGHSFGGRVAVQLAASRPTLVRGLVLTGVPLFKPRGTNRPPAIGFRVARALNRAGVLGDDRMERARQRYGSADYRAASGVMRDVLVTTLHEDYGAQLRAISCPVRLVWGSDDTAAPVAVADAALALLGDAELRVVPGAGHLVPLSAPAALRAGVDELLR